MELSIPFVNTITHQIFVIYLDQAKLKALGLCVGVKGKTHTLKTTYDIDYKS
jgi:hypothetical protein